MYIEGYAFNENKDEMIKEKNERLEEIKHLKEWIDYKITPEYKRTSFRGIINEDSDEAMALSEKDIFLLVTDGHIPFGGFCDKNRTDFKGAKYTD